MKVLILCTGNSCRSQIAEGLLKSFDSRLEVVSAGTKPSSIVHPLAVKVMKDINIDISNNRPECVEKYLNDDISYVITVCGGANENCPTFIGNVSNRVHIGFDDPAEAIGTDDEILSEFVRIRDEIKRDLFNFYSNTLKPQL